MRSLSRSSTHACPCAAAAAGRSLSAHSALASRHRGASQSAHREAATRAGADAAPPARPAQPPARESRPRGRTYRQTPSPSQRIPRQPTKLPQPRWPSLTRLSTAIWRPQPTPQPPPLTPPPPRPPPPAPPLARLPSGNGGDDGAPNTDPWLVLLLAALGASVLALHKEFSDKDRPPRTQQRGRAEEPAQMQWWARDIPAPSRLLLFRHPGELEEQQSQVLSMTEAEARNRNVVRSASC